jgi:hypothetical protein
MALAQDTAIDRSGGGPEPTIHELPVAAAALLYSGSMCCCDTAGRLVVASATAGLSPCYGICKEQADNSAGAAGAINGKVRPGVFTVGNSGTDPCTIADRGSYCYCEDDETVARTNPGLLPIAGVVMDVDATGVHVLFGPQHATAVAGGAAAGSHPLKTVRGASTANVANLAAFTVANDGITFVEDERVLLKDQAAQDENGIYVVGVVAAGSAPLTRALDADGSDEVIPGMTVVVAEGTAGADTAWQLTTNALITVDTTNLVFAQVSYGYGAAGAMVTQTIAADAAGTSPVAARIDHNHDFGTAAPTVNLTTTSPAVDGVATTFSRSDHEHDFELASSNAAGRPAAATAGLLHDTTDTNAGLYRDNGAAWVQVAPRLQKVTATITSADLTTAGVGPETENIGAVIPQTAIVVGVRADLTDAFDNGAGVSLAMEIGHDNDADAYEDGFDCFTGSALEGAGFAYTTPGPALGCPAFDGTSTGQITATFTAGADQLANFTNGSVTVEVLYLDLA